VNARTLRHTHTCTHAQCRRLHRARGGTCPAICKSGWHVPPRALWSRRHCACVHVCVWRSVRAFTSATRGTVCRRRRRGRREDRSCGTSVRPWRTPAASCPTTGRRAPATGTARTPRRRVALPTPAGGGSRASPAA